MDIRSWNCQARVWLLMWPEREIQLSHVTTFTITFHVGLHFDRTLYYLYVSNLKFKIVSQGRHHVRQLLFTITLPIYNYAFGAISSPYFLEPNKNFRYWNSKLRRSYVWQCWFTMAFPITMPSDRTLYLLQFSRPIIFRRFWPLFWSLIA